MIRAKYVPKSSVENAIAAFTVEGASWEDVIAAAINAWPGVYEYKGREGQSLSLPLTQENNNGSD